MAKDGNPQAFEIPYVLTRRPDCNFSFTGIRESFKRIIIQEEEKHKVIGSGVVPNASDICAAFQYAVLHHLSKRVQRGLTYCEQHDLLPVEKKVLVVSGGVASNQFIRQGLATVCSHYDCNLICPPPKLCTDNGIMIAWNGVEKLRINSGISLDPQAVNVERRSDVGQDISDHVEKCFIKPKRIKLL